jgi:hypothetical protein
MHLFQAKSFRDGSNWDLVRQTPETLALAFPLPVRHLLPPAISDLAKLFSRERAEEIQERIPARSARNMNF